MEKTDYNFLENPKSISFVDNKNRLKYTITKDEKNQKYIVEGLTTKTIDFNEKLDTYFEMLENYFDSIDTREYWPNNNREYPDLFILWKMVKSEKDIVCKNGALKYPDNWESILEQLKNIAN